MKLRRILALTLSFLLVLALFGCEKLDLSGSKKPSSQGSSGTDVSDPDVLVIKTVLQGSQSLRPEEGASQWTDLLLGQIARVEKETGKTVQVEIVSQESMETGFVRASRSGKKYADLIQAEAPFLSRYYEEGFFLSLVDAGVESSSTGVLKKQDGTAYAFRADGWNHPLPTVSYLMYCNEKLFLDAGLESPLEYQEAGAWNWVNFKKLAKQISAAYPGEVYALAHPTETETDLIWATLHAAGTVYFDDEGVCTMDSAEGLEGFATLRELLTAGITYRLGSAEYNESDPSAKLAFTNRRTAFLVGNSSLLFETDSGSLTENLKEDLRILGFPAIRKGVSQAVYSVPDVFLAVSSQANKELCKELIPLLFAAPEGTDPKANTIENYFYHEEDGELYFDLLASADTDTSFGMGENRSLVESYFYQVANGASAKEYLSNFQTIFNSQKG